MLGVLFEGEESKAKATTGGLKTPQTTTIVWALAYIGESQPSVKAFDVILTAPILHTTGTGNT